jgi:hypothetical protein
MPFWSRLFGSSGSATETASANVEDYKGFLIAATPIREGGQFRVAARIERDGRRHDLVRADTMASLDEATSISLAKARQLIDERGDKLLEHG